MAWLYLTAAIVWAQGGARVQPGPQTDGRILLPNGWTISPAGPQIPLGTLPMSIVLTKDGATAFVLNGGFLPPSISVIDVATQRETARVPVEDAWHGLKLNLAEDKLYVGGGSEAAVYEFPLADGKLGQPRKFPVVAAGQRRDSDHVGDVELSADGRMLYAANLFRDWISITNTQTGTLLGGFRTGRRPYRLLLSPGGQLMFVSHWAESTVGVYRIADGQLVEQISVGAHPAGMALLPGKLEEIEGRPPIAARLFVACANTNSVYSIGLTAANSPYPLERIDVGPTPSAPAGSLPTSLALSPGGKMLYIVSSGNNLIVAADIASDRANLLGAVPTGWWPTAAAVHPDGSLLYLNGKGTGSKPAPNGPNPEQRGAEQQYVAAMQTGTLGILPPVSREVLAALTERVIRNTPYDDASIGNPGSPTDHPIPNAPGQPSPIEHVVYVIKENRTYDQLFGSDEPGEGDKSLEVFGPAVTPNQHKLAREFTLLDNFHAVGDVSADGQNWSLAALANDFIEKLWPSYYGRRRRIYDFEGGEPAAVPPAQFLWSNALLAKIPLRNYGFWHGAANRPDGRASVNDAALTPHTDTAYRGFDLETTDQVRVDGLLREFREFEASAKWPRLILVRLPNDHTAGRSPGFRTPRAMMADNDYALGRLAEQIGKSKVWLKTAIFVIEDDAQDGADHVDSHRAPALVISPYAKRGTVDNSFYNTLSVLRTIELILGLKPMTQFDAAAKPMNSAFQPKADARPYEAVKPEVDLDEVNPPGSGGRPRRVENNRKPGSERPAAD